MYVPPCGGRGQNRCRHPNDWRARFGRPEVASGAKLFIQQHGETVAGRKIELIIRDDAGVPDNGKRLAQELIVKDKVSFLGAGTTPTAMAMAPLAKEAKVATVVMVSGTSVVTERSPYYVRTSLTLGQQSGIHDPPGLSSMGWGRTDIANLPYAFGHSADTRIL